ncbi:MAG: hypothetical protein Q4P18_07275 [Methanobrevibacter sp.]|uniref:hypothetical protein n=1 Tax=Methanobrevibacter sp. TaxID=66852 RepID=UPI0026DEAD44|nr:hypothetical protein [Methanobrevibacter sp.]MDO5849319.1 hypothetical protein [Methanobrevibacter sp.]
MSKHYAISIDNIEGRSKDQKTLDTVCKIIENAGNKVSKLGIGPGVMQRWVGSNECDVMVMIGGGRDIGMNADFCQGISRGYYKAKRGFIAHTSWIGNKYNTCESLKNYKYKTLEGDANASVSKQWGAKWPNQQTYAEFMAQPKVKALIGWCCANSPEQLAKCILKDGGSDVDDNESETSASTIKDAIKEVLAFWDGEVECKAINEKVFINKIPDPTENSKLELTEGVNIIQDSISITDINPDTVNFLTVHWEGGEDIVLRDENLIERFGEKPKELDAVKYVVAEENTENSSETTGDATNTEDTTSDTEEVDDASQSSTSTSQITAVPVETLEEAQHFANIEWMKIKRNNGHSVECKIIPGEEWQSGNWVKIQIPRFEEDQYMYISKASHSESDSGWECSIHLVDYPPGFGKPKEKSEEEEGEEEVEETEEEDTNASS